MQNSESDAVSCPKWMTEGVGCGQEIHKGHKFCTMCGWKINANIFKNGAKMCHNKMEEQKICENIVYPPQKFCSNCGHRLSFGGKIVLL